MEKKDEWLTKPEKCRKCKGTGEYWTGRTCEFCEGKGKVSLEEYWKKVMRLGRS